MSVFHLFCQAQLGVDYGGLGGDALYFSCGEGPFPLRRLQQLAVRFEPLHGTSKQLLSRVHINECHDLDDLYITLVGLYLVRHPICYSVSGQKSTRNVSRILCQIGHNRQVRVRSLYILTINAFDSKFGWSGAV